MEQKLSQGGTPLYVSPAAAAGKHSHEGPKPTVVFVHNMWSTHKVFHRHVKLFNHLGYATVTFDLFKSGSMRQTREYIAAKGFVPVYKTHVLQIKDVLDSVEGTKIVFCFSGPSLAGAIASADRKDVVAYICDGGPFREMWSCTLRMFRQHKLLPTEFLRVVGVTASYFIWGKDAFPSFQKALSRWPRAIPMLSIRGEQDLIVHVENIENAFKNYPDLPLTVALLPGVGHLDGLKKFPEAYEAVLVGFLNSHSL